MADVATRLRTLVVPESCLELPSDDTGGIWFGYGIVFDEIHGQIIVSVPNKYHNFGAGAKRSGAVYTFNSTTGASLQELLPTSAEDQVSGACFGYSIAQSGNWLAITAAFGVGAAIGSVYFYEWTGAAWVYRQREHGNGALAANAFGCSVAMSGSLCVVGDNTADISGLNSGTVHIFRLSGGVWAEDVAAKQHAVAVQASQYFGSSVAVSGVYIAVGAKQFFGDYDDQGRVYIFEDVGVGNPLTLRSTLVPDCGAAGETLFGDSVDIDNNYCSVGWTYHDHPGHPVQGGAVVVFKRSGVNWAFHQHLDCPIASSGINANLGYGNGNGSVRLAGEFLLGGARGWQDSPPSPGWWGAAFIWKRDSITSLYIPLQCGLGGVYQVYPEAMGEFGSAVDILSDGQFVVGATDEYQDWVNNYALPEGPPPLWTYGGTVRQYILNDPPYLIDGPSGTQNDYVLRN